MRGSAKLMVLAAWLAALTIGAAAQAQGAGALLELDKSGLSLKDAQGRTLDHLALRAKRWDQRALPGGGQVALLQDADSAELLLVRSDGLRLSAGPRWKGPGFNLESLCLHRDAQQLLHALLLDEDGFSEQWLISEQGAAPRPLRRLATPPGAKSCQVRDTEALLYVPEAGVGLWAYGMDPERSTRRLVQSDPAAGAGLLEAWLASHPEAPAAAALPVLLATGQTAPVAGHGDAADDPAIWVHPRRPGQSRILATDKKRGLAVHDLQGRQTQFLAVGRINNVDLRQGLRYQGRTWDLAAATQRDEGSIVLFDIAANGRVRELARLPTPLGDIYGLCVGRNRLGQLDVFANDKDGSLLQLRVLREAGVWRGQVIRRLKLDSQPEGCVVDERTQQLFVGEEKRGIWRLALDEAANSAPELILGVGGPLQADVEGLAIYQGKRGRYLVVSSQGNDSFLVLDADAPHALRGAFRIGINAALGIDGVSETDGLDVTAASLGGPYAEGLLVVQDGHKRLPQGTQNFKLVPWSAVARRLNLP